ncbi:MAG TPA: hypothetical protein VHJ34_14230, partial [Actinomycetota bacterium]|nr:hypothetical protein [Actinomycetota bacterium]
MTPSLRRTLAVTARNRALAAGRRLATAPGPLRVLDAPSGALRPAAMPARVDATALDDVLAAALARLDAARAEVVRDARAASWDARERRAARPVPSGGEGPRRAPLRVSGPAGRPGDAGWPHEGDGAHDRRAAARAAEGRDGTAPAMHETERHRGDRDAPTTGGRAATGVGVGGRAPARAGDDEPRREAMRAPHDSGDARAMASATRADAAGRGAYGGVMTRASDVERARTAPRDAPSAPDATRRADALRAATRVPDAMSAAASAPDERRAPSAAPDLAASGARGDRDVSPAGGGQLARLVALWDGGAAHDAPAAGPEPDAHDTPARAPNAGGGPMRPPEAADAA